MSDSARSSGLGHAGSDSETARRAVAGAHSQLLWAAAVGPVVLAAFGVGGLVWNWAYAWGLLAASIVSGLLVFVAWRAVASASAVSAERSDLGERRYRELFEQSPVAIWENDWSPVKREVDRLMREGVEDIESYLASHRDVAQRLIDSTRIVDVNRAAVAMYGLSSSTQVTEHYVLDVPESEVQAFCRRVGAFVRGEGPIVLETVDARFDNSEFEIRTTSDVPDSARDDWSRVLHIVEDITEQREALRAMQASELRYRELFQQSPVSIWVEDWSAVKPLIDRLREVIGDDIGGYIESHPEFVDQAYDAMKLVDINDAGWRMMGAKSKDELVAWAAGPLQEADRAQTAKILSGFAAGHERIELEDNRDFTLDDRDIYVRGVSFMPPTFVDDWSRVIHVFEDTTERHRAEQRANESSQLLELAQHMSGHGHFVYDADLDKVVACSKELVRIFGVEPQDFQTSQVRSLSFVHPEDRDQVASDVRRAIDQREPLATAYRVQRPDGSIRHVRHVSAFMTGEDGEPTNLRIGTVHDITELRATEEELRRARDEAERANRSKSEFLANVSHELRTPLNAIIGFSDVLLDGIFGELENPRFREYIGDINDSGRHLLELINDILDLSKAEAGRLELSEEDIVVERLIRQSVRMVQDRAQRSDIEIVQNVPADLPLISVDPRKLRQVLLNLLSNAVKFTPAGGSVAIEVDVLEQGGLDIVVADTGIGMRAEEIDRALEVFGQVDSALARRYEGTGLGLPLAHAIVLLHGGELLIESAPGGGTRVTVRLPAERVMPASLRRSP